jgi:hypothetical protein
VLPSRDGDVGNSNIRQIGHLFVNLNDAQILAHFGDLTFEHEHETASAVVISMLACCSFNKLMTVL